MTITFNIIFYALNLNKLKFSEFFYLPMFMASVTRVTLEDPKQITKIIKSKRTYSACLCLVFQLLNSGSNSGLALPE